MALTYIQLQAPTSPGDRLYADSIGSDKAQIVKLDYGIPGATSLVTALNPLPINTVQAVNDGGVMFAFDKVKRFPMHLNGSPSTVNAIGNYSSSPHGIFQAMSSHSSGGYLLLKALHIFVRSAGITNDVGNPAKFFERSSALGTSIQISANDIGTPATVNHELLGANLVDTFSLAHHADWYDLRQTAGYTLGKFRFDLCTPHGYPYVRRTGASTGEMFCVTLKDDMSSGLADLRFTLEGIDLATANVTKHFDTVLI